MATGYVALPVLSFRIAAEVWAVGKLAECARGGLYVISMPTWWPRFGSRRARRLHAKRGEVQRCIDEGKEEIEDALSLAALAGDPDADKHAEKALADFAGLAARAAAASTDAELEWIKEQAEAVQRQRAYVLPDDALYEEGLFLIEELEEWNLPESVIQRLKDRLQRLANFSAKSHQRRQLLTEIEEDADYWNFETERHETFLRRSVNALVPTCVVCLALSLVCFLSLRQAVAGFIVAGVGGAALSIVLKLPPLQVYGETVGRWQRIAARLAAGAVASAVGLGLLASGMVNVGIPSRESGFVSAAAMLAECQSRGCPAASATLLLSLGIIFGFSERAITSFERVIMSRIPRSVRRVRRPTQEAQLRETESPAEKTRRD